MMSIRESLARHPSHEGMRLGSVALFIVDSPRAVIDDGADVHPFSNAQYRTDKSPIDRTGAIEREDGVRMSVGRPINTRFSVFVLTVHRD